MNPILKALLNINNCYENSRMVEITSGIFKFTFIALHYNSIRFFI